MHGAGRSEQLAAGCRDAAQDRRGSGRTTGPLLGRAEQVSESAARTAGQSSVPSFGSYPNNAECSCRKSWPSVSANRPQSVVFWVAITEDYRKSGVGTRETGSLSFNGEYSCLVLSMLAGRQQFRRDPSQRMVEEMCSPRTTPRMLYSGEIFLARVCFKP